MTPHPDYRRSLRLANALRADRIERRLGRELTDEEFDRLSRQYDSLMLRQMWLRHMPGGRLEVHNGRLELGGAT